jgi:hypothetical protein
VGRVLLLPVPMSLYRDVGLETLTAVTDVTQCSLVDMYRRVGGIYYLHLQGRIW